MAEYDNVVDKVLYGKLLNIFKKYPTSIQDTILHIISIRLRELYASIDEFPENVLSPGSDRYDILLAKAAQYDYDINSRYSLSEQINLLNSIYDIYSKRGSIESIENMWKYYGGDLPKDVEVTIPAYDIFRYSVSKLSGTHRFQDNLYYRAGVYTINIDGNYDIEDIREFVVKELVAAGTNVNFHRRVPLDFVGDDADMKSDTVLEDTQISINMMVNLSRSGLTWSAHSVRQTWSGSPNLFVDIVILHYLDYIYLNTFYIDEVDISYTKSLLVRMISYNTIRNLDKLILDIGLSYSSNDDKFPVSIHYYDDSDPPVEILPDENFPGYFILAKTKLGELILRDES